MIARTVVIIPTYNEAANIEELIHRIHALYPDVDILIVDDNSPDGTAGIVRRLAASDNRIRLITRPGKDGLGRAYIEGFRHVLGCGHAYDLIVEMDADLSHDPAQLRMLLLAAEHADCVVGSRYIAGGQIANWARHRRIISSVGNLYARFFLGSGIKDWTSGYRVFKRTVLEHIALDSISSKGYLFQIEVLHNCVRQRYAVAEVPIRFCERKKGRTKLGLMEIWEAVWGVALMRLLRAREDGATPQGRKNVNARL
ncbi:MAG TPA: polyprenol monophosphomannose synthase [Candidatus Omnitrophota bacterium]|nr:polyprenol monophosphomannose synthase [Candidatus Omnitrophota bacterium]HQO37886.1 polyprenol monophosphomannose synthase [Candidatus Omnitrophota bacterium]HQQ06370.1 polyprenol monophosphomannose synthase [Candidatus Omnitrophota bacterium]